MNKTELIASVAEKAGLTKKDAEKAINALFVSVEEALALEDKVQIIGFGTFEVKAREERKGRNPQTGAEITIPASKNPVFKAGKGLKDAVNK
ncbi:HU family DNA-binding protein [Pelosinus sp. sgz500959]|uniref:HU family DNA-binding protein n=1 Tax=Pelosinus sp. sgz500959 TaxID=3242472 RepID=UPI00366F2DBD